MGHRYYIWALPKEKRISYIGDEIKRSLELAAPRLRNSQSPTVFRKISINKDRNIVLFQIARSERKRYRDYNRENDTFTVKYLPYWRFYNCYWDVSKNYIEIRGGKKIQEEVFNELISIFKYHFEFKPINICDKAFSYITKTRISAVTDKEYYVEGGYITMGGVCLTISEYDEFRKFLKMRKKRGRIAGLYSLPGTLIIEPIIKLPVFLDQVGKIRFFKIKEEKDSKKDAYELITRKIVDDILSIIKKYCNNGKKDAN